MSTTSSVFCYVCNEEMVLDEDLEHHLVYQHKPRELAKQLVAEWQAEELGEAV
ncbi:hypothetical protein JMJ58_04330 [Haloterrigena salifodinae]|uniref:Uncharacterized protein n=1 Tax=Haloterrigena salifodinae TaxID=2675099 RepID=A0A8T8E407_9EURY|nr:hypothetical protein [Haloterrigena salifodinae]QRV16131.1 hypothetical protein JMJ58_04330 [Haloterrigena salifodinae]